MKHMNLTTAARALRLGALALTTTLLIPAMTVTGADYELKKHRIEWSGSMPASTHKGLLTPEEFSVDITDEGKVDYLKVVLDMDSINVTDLEGKKRDKLMNHLRSEDFFYVEKYPTARFVMDEHRDGYLYGTITIRGVSEQFSIPVEVRGHEDRGWMLTGAFTFDRQNFNVNYQNSGFFGVAKDKIIKDEVELDIELTVATK